MADPAPFQQEKQEALGVPARGTSTAPFAVAPPTPAPAPAAPPKGRDPRVTLPYSRLRVSADIHCIDMEDLAMVAPTFRRHMEKLATRQSHVAYKVMDLPRKAGGGSSTPELNSPDYLIMIDPKTIKAGFHVFEVFLHEHGHVAELHKMAVEGVEEAKYYLEFMNTVQAELGLRVTPDTHE